MIRRTSLVILVAISLFLTACGGGAASPATTAPDVQPTSRSGQATEEPQAVEGKEHTVEIGDNTFSPQELTIAVGDTVSWVNEGERPHTATADDGSFNSDTLKAGASFKQTFDKPGVFAYFCSFHGDKGGSGMAGTITVTGGEASAPTPTFERVDDATPTSSAPAAAGLASFHDEALRGDVLAVAVEGLERPASGEVYAVWLSGAEQSLLLGTLEDAGAEGHTLEFVSPEQENLLSRYDRLVVAQVPEGSEKLPESALLSGEIPDNALVHIRHVLVGIGSTPNKLGFALGLRQESDELLRHAQFLRDAFEAGDLALEKVHAEHITNIIVGAQSDAFGDLNGDGEAQNPGDGFGLLQNGQQDGYIKGMIDHARLAAESPDATDSIKVHAEHVGISGENTTERVERIRDLARSILDAGSVAATEEDMRAILSTAEQAVQGNDKNRNEQIEPVAGEGGVLTAYQHAQLMALISLSPGGELSDVSTTKPAPKPTEDGHSEDEHSAPEPTKEEDSAPPAGGPVEVVIGDNSFTAKEISVPVGATIIWKHQGQRPHTVTADDGSFDSEIFNGGGSFKQTFSKAGVFAYYCELHGGPGGVGMSGTIRVGD